MLLSVRLIIFCLLFIVLVFIFRYLSSPFLRLACIILLFVVTTLSVVFIPTLKQQWIELTDFSGNTRIALDKDASLGKSWGGKSIRVAIWQCSMDIVNRHWLLGVGTGDVQDSLQAAYEKRKFYFASRFNRYNVHNQLLELWIGNGLPGLLIYLLCLVVPMLVY